MLAQFLEQIIKFANKPFEMPYELKNPVSPSEEEM